MMRKMIGILLVAMGIAGMGTEANAQYGYSDSGAGQARVRGSYGYPGSSSWGSTGKSGATYRYGAGGNSSGYYSGYGSSGSYGGYGYRYRKPHSNQGYYPGYYNLYGSRAIGTMYQY